MFINYLNKSQQACLLGLSKLLIEADGVLSEKESEIMEVIRSQCDVSISEENNPLAMIEKLFVDNSSKVALLLELVGIAYADSEYHEEEKTLINKVADLAGVNPELLIEIESWVKRQVSLVEDAQKMMEV